MNEEMAIRKYYVFLDKEGKWHARVKMNWENNHTYRNIVTAESYGEAIRKAKKEYGWEKKGKE